MSSHQSLGARRWAGTRDRQRPVGQLVFRVSFSCNRGAWSASGIVRRWPLSPNKAAGASGPRWHRIGARWFVGLWLIERRWQVSSEPSAGLSQMSTFGISRPRSIVVWSCAHRGPFFPARSVNPQGNTTLDPCTTSGRARWLFSAENRRRGRSIRSRVRPVNKVYA